jgi:hypothetical protein
LRLNFFVIPEDPVFNTPGQSARHEKKLLANEIEPIKALCGKSFFSSRALCPEVLKTRSSGMIKTLMIHFCPYYYEKVYNNSGKNSDSNRAPSLLSLSPSLSSRPLQFPTVLNHPFPSSFLKQS